MVDGKSSPIRSACFVLPTYNEAQNIVAIIRQILVLGHANLTVQILVVDDSSPDGTADLVHALNDERVRVLSGQKRGLGSAYTRAFEYVLEHMSVDAVVQMDADFSHAPMDASRLLAQLANTDVAIGSRYVAGGSVDPA